MINIFVRGIIFSLNSCIFFEKEYLVRFHYDSFQNQVVQLNDPADLKPLLVTRPASLKIPDFKLFFIFTFCAYIVYPLVIFCFNVLFSNVFVNQHVPRAHTSPCPILTPVTAYDFNNEGNTNYKIELKLLNIFQIFILCFGMITLLRLSCLYLYNRVRYVCFTTNLSLISKKKTFNQHNFFLIFLSLLTFGLLVELENNQILLFVVLMNPHFGRLIN